MNINVIDLSRSYWTAGELRKDLARVRKLIIDLLNNLQPSSDIDAAEIGYCLQCLEMMDDAELVDERKVNE